MKKLYHCAYCGRISTIRESYETKQAAEANKAPLLFCDEECQTLYNANKAISLSTAISEKPQGE